MVISEDAQDYVVSTYDQPKGRRDSGPWLKTMVTHACKCNKSQENSICK